MTKPSDEEIIEFMKEYGHVYLSPTHQPKVFMYYWKLFKYLKERRTSNEPNS